MFAVGSDNICFTKIFTLIIIILALDIKSTQCIKTCASCRESFALCNKTTGVCKSNCRRTKLCAREDDLCLATWRWRNDKLVMFTSCFRLPPFSNSSHYTKECKARVLNGTRTCLCQGSNCNKNPTQPVKKNKKNKMQASRLKRNVTQDSSRKIEIEPTTAVSRKASNVNVSTIVSISLAGVLLSLVIAGLISRLQRCNKHIETTLSDVAVEDFKNEKVRQEAELSNSVELDTVLSQGRYASVWKGRVMGQLVAVKIFPVTAMASWQNEHDIYELLSVEHSNVAKIIPWEKGCDAGNDPLWLIMDYCEHGSLREYLQRKILSWREAVVLASGLTSGVAFLHSESVQMGKMKVAIAHRDLKSTNVLVRKDGTAVITDFGLAVALNSVEDESKNIQVGTYRYMSPEELLTTVDLESAEAFKQMDIYSMALVLWEIISRCEVAESLPNAYQLPYAEMVSGDVSLDNMVEVVAVKQCRPRLPDTDHEGLKMMCQTVQECWDPDPEARLTADCTKIRLDELLF